MQPVATLSSSLVSARITALILTSPRLKRMLLPEGLRTSPYEILDYRMMLVLHDPKGTRATFMRTQRIRFLQDGVSGVLDHAWGDGIVLTDYRNDAGTLEDSFRDEGRRHLVVGLKRPMRKGEILTFSVERTAMEGFMANEEWLETTIDHPVERLSCGIVFPKQRPCQRATLHYEGEEVALPVGMSAGEKTVVRLKVPTPRSDTPYTVRWSW